MEKLIEDLKREEGLRLEVYIDTKGYPTVGYGCRVAVGDKINTDVAEALFSFRLARVVNDFYKIPHELTRWLNTPRRRVICQMIYQLGLRGTLGFVKMWKAIKNQDFDTAAAEMLDSVWARETSGRVYRLAQVMKEGRDGV